jgi:hypothetical protein
LLGPIHHTHMLPESQILRPLRIPHIVKIFLKRSWEIVKEFLVDTFQFLK